MIIWGNRDGASVLGDLEVRACPVCEKKVPFQARLYYKFIHIWYIISWITSREYKAVCSHCGNGIPMDKTEAKIKYPSDGIPFMRKNGWLVALILGLSILGYVYASIEEDNKRYQAYLSEPQVGDVYLANFKAISRSGFEKTTEKAAYGYMALVKIEDDKLVFVTCKKAFNKKKGVRKALSAGVGKNDYDMKTPLVLTKQRAQGLLENSIIYEIRR